MRLLLIIPTLKQGGAERVMSQLANYWAKLGHSVHLVLLAEHVPFYTLNKNVTVHELGFRNINPVQKIFSEIRTACFLRRVMKTEKFDFTLSFMEKYNILTIGASLFLGLKVYVSDRSNPMLKRKFIIKFLRLFMYRFSTGIIAQTKLSEEIIKKEFPGNKVLLLPNPVKDICLERKAYTYKQILNVGRLVPGKGQDLLVEAFSKVKAPGWRLLFLGEGYKNSELEKQIKDLHMQNKVLMLGADHDIDKYYSESSVFAFTSMSEGFPNALCEAMASGLACVSFDCNAGPRDLIDNGVSGILIPVGDVKELTNSLQLLIDNEELRIKLGEAAQKTARKYALDKVATQWIRCLSENDGFEIESQPFSP